MLKDLTKPINKEQEKELLETGKRLKKTIKKPYLVIYEDDMQYTALIGEKDTILSKYLHLIYGSEFAYNIFKNTEFIFFELDKEEYDLFILTEDKKRWELEKILEGRA